MLLLITLLVIGASAQRCINLDSQCQSWGGYCHLPEVSVRCPVTCNQCPESAVEEVYVPVVPIVPGYSECQDNNAGCPDWRDLCMTHTGVQADCARTCGLCQVQVPVIPAVVEVDMTPLATEPTPECADKYTACQSPFWLGLCDTDAEVQQDCPRACGLCEDQGPVIGLVEEVAAAYEEAFREQVEETEEPEIETEAPFITTEAPVITTEAPVYTTQARVVTERVTEARVETEAPYVVTDAPVEECEDRLSECAVVASAFNSICQVNAQVRADCPRSCDLCPAEVPYIPEVVVPVVTEAPESDCQDKYTACTAPFWLELCSTNSGVQDDCPRACGLCPDQSPGQEQWVKSSIITTNAPVVPTEAPVVETEAPVVETEAPAEVTTMPPIEQAAPVTERVECRDYYTACEAPFWKKLCATNTQVQHDCARSCGLCQDQEPGAENRVEKESVYEEESVYQEAPVYDVEAPVYDVEVPAYEDPVYEQEEVFPADAEAEQAEGPCEDKHSACAKPFWVEACDSNTGVQSDCPRSCNLCPDQIGNGERKERKRGKGRKKACNDIYTDCAGLVAAGWCEYEMKPGHLGQYKLGIVSENCKKSCNLC